MKRLLFTVFLFPVFLIGSVHAQSSSDSTSFAVVPVEDSIFVSPDKPASFHGGEKANQAYIKKSIQYPEEAIVNNESGKVVIEFVVEKDGSISNLRVKNSVSSSLDKESLRIIRSMPKWVPAQQNGIVVRSIVEVPFIFKLG